jgi:biopolymer transport protein ExbD
VAGTMDTGRGRTRPIAAINVTPLVDVVLVLLVILMVASTYIVAQTLKVQLPRAHSTDGTADKPTKIEILKDGKMRWNEAFIQEPALADKMKEAATADPEMSLVVSADREVMHGNVVHVLDLAKIAGITKFAINVQQAGE